VLRPYVYRPVLSNGSLRHNIVLTACLGVTENSDFSWKVAEFLFGQFTTDVRMIGFA
jgi:hypothetical protein